MLLPYNRAQKKGVWNPTPCARNVASAQAQGSRHLFFVGDLRWPNGPWPGEKTPYFTAKTGHMARHGIWPSDRLCLRWADRVEPRHGLDEGERRGTRGEG